MLEEKVIDISYNMVILMETIENKFGSLWEFSSSGLYS